MQPSTTTTQNTTRKTTPRATTGTLAAGILGIATVLGAATPALAQTRAVPQFEPTSIPARIFRVCNDCIPNEGKTLEAFVNGYDGLTGGVRVRVPKTQADGYKWGTTEKVMELVPGKEYWIAAMSEENFPHLLTTALELRNCTPTVNAEGRLLNPQAVWERTPYTHEVISMQDNDFMTLYFKGASNGALSGVRINNLQRDDANNNLPEFIQVRQEVAYAKDLGLAGNNNVFYVHNALDSPQATLDDMHWILNTVWATGQHKLITVRQVGRGTGNDGTYKGPIANGAGKYLIELYNIESDAPDGLARKVLAGELDMGGIVENGEYKRELIPFTRTFSDPNTYAELFVGKTFLNSDGNGGLDKTYKIATPNDDWAKKTVIYRPDIDSRVRPQPSYK